MEEKEITQTSSPKEEKEESGKKKKKVEMLELVIAIFLGITALATAWATWIGSLHGGNMSTNYSQSNNLSSQGSAMWNQASQSMIQDMQLWNTISDYQVEIIYADSIGDEAKMNESASKLLFIAIDNMSAEMAELIGYDFNFDVDGIINWVLNDTETATTSPFSSEEFTNSYFTDAEEVLAEADALLEEGKNDNACGDKFNLVTVIYSVVLFMLGIVGTFKSLPNKWIITWIAVAGFVLGTVYMFTIPMPTGFSLMGFFS